MMRLRSPRMSLCALLAVTLSALVWMVSPQQTPVVVYKLSLILLASFLGYWLDRWAFPYARPDGYLQRNWRMQRAFIRYEADHPVAVGYRQPFCAALLRRAIVMGCTMLAVGMGL